MNHDSMRPDGPHCDREELALAALGEQTFIDTDHLSACEECQADLAALRRIVRITRSAQDAQITAPPEAVWDAVSAAMRADSDADAASAPAGQLRERVHAPGDSSGDARGDDAKVVPLRRRTLPWLAAAAAIGVTFGAIGGVVWSQSPSPAPTVIAQADLAPLPGYPSSGTARVQTSQDGDVVTVNLTNLPQTSGYYEVWLLTEDASAMVSLGAVGPGEKSTLPLPPGIALDRFAVVDISAEEFDGDPTHSTISIARGNLQA